MVQFCHYLILVTIVLPAMPSCPRPQQQYTPDSLVFDLTGLLPRLLEVLTGSSHGSLGVVATPTALRILCRRLLASKTFISGQGESTPYLSLLNFALFKNLNDAFVVIRRSKFIL
jgi:hypothetical protein